MSYSVIIPCFNAQDYIDQALNSVLNQTVSAKEIILVDNNSTDNTLKKINDYASNYSNIKCIVETNKGASFARNAGLKIASGDYIQFLDVDDYLSNDKVKLQLEYIKHSGNDIDILFDNYVVEWGEQKRKIFNNEMSDLWLGFLKGRLGFTSSNLWRREALLKIGGFDVSLKTSEEYQLIFEILKNNGSYLMVETSSTIKREINVHSLTKSEPELNWIRYSSLRFDVVSYLEASGLVKNHHYVAFFDVLRVLYPINRILAIKYYNLLLRNKFSIMTTETTSKSYVVLFKIFGFQTTEFFKKLLK